MLAGRFEIAATLGRGGFAIAYRCRDRERGDRCVVKELAPHGVVRDDDGTLRLDLLGDRSGKLISRFLEEAELLRAIRAPGLLPVRASFEANGTAYFATDEAANARTLAELLDREGSLDLDTSLDVLYQLLETLEAIHLQGYLHRDVKPSNVLLDDAGRCYLIDFGAARQWHADHTERHTVMFTPGYAPLEQLSEHGRRGPATDLYGLCATAYHMLCGEPPLAATDRVAGARLVPPAEWRPGLDPAVSNALMAGLRLRYDERPESVRALVTLLEEAPATLADQIGRADAVLEALRSLRIERNGCPVCGAALDYPRQARAWTCPVCRDARIRPRDLAPNRCPCCSSGILRRFDHAEPPVGCPLCPTGALEGGRRGPWTCLACGAAFARVRGGIEHQGVIHTWAEWMAASPRSQVVAVCDACGAQFDEDPDGLRTQIVPEGSPWGALSPDEWARVAIGSAPDGGNAECEHCGAEYHVEGETCTLLGAELDPFGFAERHLGRRFDLRHLAWAAAGKESASPGPTCQRCGTEFDTDGSYLRLVRTTSPILARHTGEPFSLEDWNRLARELPTVLEEPAFEERFDSLLVRAFVQGTLPFDSSETDLLWRGRAARISRDSGVPAGPEGKLTVTDQEIVFQHFLHKWRTPRDAVQDAFERDGYLWLVLSGERDPVGFDIEEVELTVHPKSGPRTLLVGAGELAQRMEGERSRKER
ncbi:MAG: serine/threonine protein kinase [Fimbriimonadaceae bacterium]|nr:serine/threonine protein kinase [Fimbriimonadaceae bacterium]